MRHGEQRFEIIGQQGALERKRSSLQIVGAEDDAPLDWRTAYTRLFEPAEESELLPHSLLAELGGLMSTRPAPDNAESCIPAGYTYIGQFIAHDLTRAQILQDGSVFNNNRSSALDLDSVFGELEVDIASLDLAEHVFQCNQVKIGATYPTRSGINHNDLPRSQRGVAIVPDQRNDDHVALSQTHVSILRFCKALLQSGRCASTSEAINTTIICFQYAILNDYLKTIICPDVYQVILSDSYEPLNGRVTVNNEEKFLIPIEFSVAAFRFGHSMVRERYHFWNKQLGMHDVELQRFFENSAKFDEDGIVSNNLANGRLRAEWASDWWRLLSFEGLDSAGFQDAEHPFIKAAPIDTNIAGPLIALEPNSAVSQAPEDPFISSNLATRTLIRGRQSQVATAQHVFSVLQDRDFFEIEEITKYQLYDSDDVAKSILFNQRAPNNIPEKTPLWYYILREAELHAGGNHLGKIGSIIVMDTIVESIRAADVNIFLGAEDSIVGIFDLQKGRFLSQFMELAYNRRSI
ncbi:MAG: peroxidase family protein [Pseudomonadota bacterium]